MYEEIIDIILVDDEQLALEYLKNILDWGKYGYKIIGTANSGKQAIHMVKESHPQIVISDIRMSGSMDGIDLAMNIRESWPSITVLLVSSYKDFEYARRGIEAGVSDYLLKHELSEKYILDKLREVREKLTEEKKREQIYRKHFLRNLIQNESIHEDFIKLENGYQFVVFMIKKCESYSDFQIKNAIWTKSERKVLSISISEKSNSLCYLTDIYLTEGVLLILFKMVKQHSQMRSVEIIRSKAESISETLSNDDELEYYITTSRGVGSKQLSEVFRKMSSRIRQSIFWEKNRVYNFFVEPNTMDEYKEDKDNMNEQDISLYITDSIELIHKNLKNGDDVEYIISNLFEKLEGALDPVEEFRFLVTNLFDLMKSFCDKESIDIDTYVTIDRHNSIVEQIRIHILFLYSQIQKVMEQKNNNNYTMRVSNILKYISNHYAEDISLDTLGEAMKMNGAYCGYLLKQETGQTFVKYLTSVRLFEAKKLLDEGTLNISEIAEKVGYKSAQYFSTNFQKINGIRPMDYRRGISINEQ